MKFRELMEKRGKLIADARAILEKAETEKRANLTAEEQASYDKLIKEQDELRSQIEREKRQADLEMEMSASSEKRETSSTSQGSGIDSKEYRAAFNNYLMNGASSLTAPEIRALQQNTGSAGGFMVAPEQFVNELIKFVDDSLFVRTSARVIKINQAASLGVPSLETDPADADWTTELAVGSEDSTMAFGKRALNPQPLAKLIKVSETLAMNSAMSIDQLVMERLGYKFAVSEEKAFLTGNGANQPLGLFTASTFGITTARDVSSGNTTTSIGVDGLINAKYSLKAPYWNKASWIFHRDALSQISKLKDGNGNYLWRESIKDGEPDVLLGRPVFMSEYAPNTFTTGLYVGLLGDLSQYWIAETKTFAVKRLVELYAATNQIGFIGRQELDGMPVLAEAFARVKLA